jgi:hypothetical protein
MNCISLRSLRFLLASIAVKKILTAMVAKAYAKVAIGLLNFIPFF